MAAFSRNSVRNPRVNLLGRLSKFVTVDVPRFFRMLVRKNTVSSDTPVEESLIGVAAGTSVPPPSYLRPGLPIPRVAVMGLGLSGSITALEMAEHGYQVLAIEKGKRVVPPGSTSEAASNKLHTGMHYSKDFDTAKKCLLGSISFMRKFGTFVLDIDNPKAPSRQGMHYFMSNSDLGLTREEIIEFAENLRAYYKELVDLDPENKVFGEVDDFIQYVEPKDCPDYIARTVLYKREDGSMEESHLLLGIRTHESQIDLNAFTAYLQHKLEAHPNVTLKTNTAVKRVSYQPGTVAYSIDVTHNNKPDNTTSYTTDAVINCAWNGAEAINQTIGYFNPADNMHVRVKASVEVTLPPELRDANTCIFTPGAHCSFTTQRDTSDDNTPAQQQEVKAIITYEPATNITHFKAGNKPTDERFLAVCEPTLDGTPNKDQKALMDEIVMGAAKYLPALKDCIPNELRIGYVKMLNPVDEHLSIYSATSSVHKRTEYGVRARGLCYFDGDGTKMCLIVANQRQLLLLLQQHFRLREEVLAKIDELKRQLETKGAGVPVGLLDTVVYHTFRQAIIDAEELPFKAVTNGSLDDVEVALQRQRATYATIPRMIKVHSAVMAEISGTAPTSPSTATPPSPPRLFPIYRKTVVDGSPTPKLVKEKDIRVRTTPQPPRFR